jgi:hypothetical protein
MDCGAKVDAPKPGEKKPVRKTAKKEATKT